MVTRRIQVTGTTGMPSSAAAVVANLTAVAPRANGWLVAWPCGARPTASNVNYVKGETIAGQVSVGLDASGGFCIATSTTTHVVVDITGSYRSSGTTIGTLTPTRVVDTRVDD
jgi:acid phosphatase family membrane protein YuiD